MPSIRFAALNIVRDLDQIVIRIPEIDRKQFADSASALDRTHFDRDILLFEFTPDDFDRRLSDDAEIYGSGRWLKRFWLKFIALLMQIQSLSAEFERFTTLPERDHFEPKHGLIKGAAPFRISYGQHQVVDSINLHCQASASGRHDNIRGGYFTRRDDTHFQELWHKISLIRKLHSRGLLNLT